MSISRVLHLIIALFFVAILFIIPCSSFGQDISLSISAGDTVNVRVDHLTGYAKVFVNGSLFLTTYEDTSWRYISPYLHRGSNTVQFQVFTKQYNDYSYRVLARKNDVSVFESQDAGNCDCLPDTLLFDKTITVDYSEGCSASLSPSSLPKGLVGEPYFASIYVEGGTPPYSYSMIGQVPGLTLGKKGMISGVPSTPGTFHFTIKASDRYGCIAYRDYTIVVAPLCTLQISSSSLPDGKVGKPYSAQISVGGGTAPFNYTMKPEVTGLWITGRGVITGTPYEPGNFIFTITVTDKNGCSDSRDFRMTVSGSPTPQLSNISESSSICYQQIQTTGVQWIDFNSDKKMDLLLVGRNGNALFKNLGGCKFADVTSKLHIGNGNRSASGGAWADADNDGLTDVLIANVSGPPTVLRNTRAGFSLGGGSSPLFAHAANGTTMGGIWLDFNRDGLVDAFIINDPGPNQLYQNLGSFQFREVAAQAHLAASGPSRAAVSADFNNDGWPDIYLVKDHSPNVLYINNADGTFSVVSAGTAFSGAATQAVVSDYDNDGRIDIFVVNKQGPSVLYKNMGNLRFLNVTTRAKLNQPKSGKAAGFGDFNNDGYVDLVMLQSHGESMLFQNNGDGTFFHAGSVNLNNPQNPTGLSLGDFNSDGLLDIMIGDGGTTEEKGDSLYQNTSKKGHWLETGLRGISSNRSAIGATVNAWTGSTPHMALVSGGTGSNQDSLILFFGLGDSTSVNKLEVTWPSGTRCVYYNCRADQRIYISEGIFINSCQSWNSCR